MKVFEQQRTCFGLAWYDNEAEAVEAGKKIRESGQTINGGYFHGNPCDRVPEFDYFDEKLGQKLYAVRT